MIRAKAALGLATCSRFDVSLSVSVALVQTLDEFGSVGEGNVGGGGRFEGGYSADDLITVAFDMPADMLGEALEWDLHCIVLFSW